jgi:hypothetical protein
VVFSRPTRIKDGDAEPAEFVRLQVELAKRKEEDERRPGREARERELLGLHEAEWAGPLAGWATHWNFSRGLEEVRRPSSDPAYDRALDDGRRGPGGEG